LIYSYLVILGFLSNKVSLKIDQDLINLLFYNVLLGKMKSTNLGKILNNFNKKDEVDEFEKYI